MFVRIKKTGTYQYLQIVQTYREGKKVKQKVISTLGRLDKLREKGDINSIVSSPSKYSKNILLYSGKKDSVQSEALTIGTVLVFARLWNECRIHDVLSQLLQNRKYEFNVELAIFITVLHRLFISGSDRSCEVWMKDYRIDGSQDLSLHHFYRAMAF